MGFAAAALLFMQEPTAKTAVLIAVMVWFFCRFYYFSARKTFCGRSGGASVSAHPKSPGVKEG
jgi:hypothetical protein